MSYTPVNWEDSPSTSTPITAENLNIMDKGIADVDKRTTEIETELPKRIKDENSVIGTNHITNGAITQEKIAEDLIPLRFFYLVSFDTVSCEKKKDIHQSPARPTSVYTTLDSNAICPPNNAPTISNPNSPIVSQFNAPMITSPSEILLNIIFLLSEKY